MWHAICDMWHVTRDRWHVTCDMWHITCNMWWGVNILSKFQLPSSYSLWFISVIINVACINTMRALEVACINTMRALSYVQNANVQISSQCCITCSRVSLSAWLMSFGGDLTEGVEHSTLLCNNAMHFWQSISRKVIFLIILLNLLHPGSKIQRQSYVG